MMPNLGGYQKREQAQQVHGKLGTLENPKKYKGQDFEVLREYHLRRKLLFEDDIFPAGASSIGPKLISTLCSKYTYLNIQWKRPGEIHRDPHLLVDGASLFDIVQGLTGDCWVLSVIGALTMHHHFLDNVLPKNQGFTEKYAGIFHFRFWQFGEWVDVVIDDRLPFVNGKYMSVYSPSSNEFWPSLLEKAYAKFRGSYENLHGGFISESLLDFTGGVQMKFSLENPDLDLQDVIIAAVKSDSLVGCTTARNEIVGNYLMGNGLVKDHAYTVTNTAEVPCKNGLENLLQIWNPWGEWEWNGRWSDNCAEWKNVKPDIRKTLNMKRDDGLFWISYKDFLQHFAVINICNETPTYLDFEEQKSTWTNKRYCSRWVKGSTAGGHFNNESFSRNPQYIINVTESERSEGDYNVVIMLMQKPSNLRKSRDELLRIGFVFCKVDSKFLHGKNTLPQTFFNQNASEAFYTGLLRSSEVVQKFKKPLGTYVLVPCTEHKGLESDFILRVFKKSRGLAKESGKTLSINRPKRSPFSAIFCWTAPQSPVDMGVNHLLEGEASYSASSLNFPDGDGRRMALKNNQDSSYESIFTQYAMPGSEIDASQLQRLLNDVLFQDQAFAVNEGFTFDACRGMLILMDHNADGRLDMQEFRCLWKWLRICKDLFSENDVQQFKLLDKSGLKNALHKAGLTVSREMLKLIVLRYGDSSKRLNFTDFVSCIIRLETVSKVFHNLTKDGKGIYQTGEEWMQMIMSS